MTVCRCIVLTMIATATVNLYGAKKPVKVLRDLHFRYSMDRPGVSTIVVKDKPKKPIKAEQKPVFSVWDKETVATPENDSTFFVRINSMQRWSVKSPVTYAVTLALGEEKITRHFGIRDLEVRNGMICLNDTTILRKGLTESALPISTLKSTEEWRNYFREIKRKGFSVISLTRNAMSHELMTAADLSGIMVHARVTPPVKVETDDGKKKKKKKKKDEVEVVLKNLATEYIEHPSLCMASFENGTKEESSDKYLKVCHFHPTKDEEGKFHPDYSHLLDSTRVCLADLSELQDGKEVEKVLEKVLCTEGIGAILFGSVEQASAWKDVMMLGKFDRDSWDSSMAMSMDLIISNNSEQDIRNTNFSWEFADETGFVFSQGNEGGHRFLPYNTNYVATAFTPMAFIFPGSTVTLTVKMDGSDLQRSWSHKILYPARIRYMNEEINKRMKNWCKRKSGETDVEYAERVNDVTKAHKRKLFAYDIVTEEADEIVTGRKIKLSRYNAATGTVTVTVDNLAPFKLKVPHKDAEAFLNEEDLELRDTRFGLTNKDDYEIVSTMLYNKRTHTTVLYENYDSESTLERILIDDKYVPMELKELAEREDSILQEIKQNVIQSAKEQNLITDHTQIDVRAHFATDFDQNGNTLNNYQVIFDYNVDAQYSLTEDYGSGRYRIEDSHAAISMLRTITSAFGRDFGRYIKAGKKLDISITGSADSSPIRGSIAYNGCYGEFYNESYYLGSEESKLTITAKDGIRQNEQLAYMRAQGVHDFLSKNLTGTEEMDVRYLYNIELPKGRGGQFRRIKVCFTFVDAF